MTVPDRAVYADMLANPDDDGPRRVYADWLIERGDPRGELIVVQCELAAVGDGDPRRSELERRESQLIAEAGARWRTELGLPALKFAGHRTSALHAYGSTLVLRRGLIDEAKLDAAELAAIGSAVGHLPLRRLILTNLDESGAEQLARLPGVPTLTALRVRDATLKSTGAAAFGAAPLVRAVRDLEFHRAQFERESLERLGGAALPALVTLVFDKSHARVQELAAATWLPQLESFVLASHYGGGVDALLRSPAWRDLRVLDLNDSYIDDVTLASIPDAPIAPSLTKLVIAAGRIGVETVRSFVKTRRLGRLQRLELSGYCDLGADAIAALRNRFGDKLWIEGPIHMVP